MDTLKVGDRVRIIKHICDCESCKIAYASDMNIEFEIYKIEHTEGLEFIKLRGKGIIRTNLASNVKLIKHKGFMNSSFL